MITVFVEAIVDSSTESRKLVGDGFELEKDWKSSGPKLTADISALAKSPRSSYKVTKSISGAKHSSLLLRKSVPFWGTRM